MPCAKCLVGKLTRAARELGETDTEDPRDHMPDGGAYQRVVDAELALIDHIEALEARIVAITMRNVRQAVQHHG